MAQNDLIKALLESNSGINLITDLLDASPEVIENQAFTILQANPQLKDVLDAMSKKDLDELREELNSTDLKARLQGFKTGVDLAFTLMGYQALYDVLPENFTEAK